jgi:cystathionine beta-lyase
MQDDTLLVHTAREPERHYEIVNPPVCHASTILYPTLEACSQRADSAEKKGSSPTLRPVLKSCQ